MESSHDAIGGHRLYRQQTLQAAPHEGPSPGPHFVKTPATPFPRRGESKDGHPLFQTRLRVPGAVGFPVPKASHLRPGAFPGPVGTNTDLAGGRKHL